MEELCSSEVLETSENMTMQFFFLIEQLSYLVVEVAEPKTHIRTRESKVNKLIH